MSPRWSAAPRYGTSVKARAPETASGAEEGEREHDSPDAGGVLADRRGDEEGDRSRERPEPEEEGKRATAGAAAQRERGTGSGEAYDGEELGEAEERVLRVLGVDEEQGSLKEPDDHEPGAEDDRASAARHAAPE